MLVLAMQNAQVLGSNVRGPNARPQHEGVCVLVEYGLKKNFTQVSLSFLVIFIVSLDVI